MASSVTFSGHGLLTVCRRKASGSKREEWSDLRAAKRSQIPLQTQACQQWFIANLCSGWCTYAVRSIADSGTIPGLVNTLGRSGDLLPLGKAHSGDADGGQGSGQR